ncbi:hypothetical protein [Cryobacterium sp. Y11]|uniref:hypothetical protein n=1 Tax=Cryobacterium sp. Y11 TaxID=2045016 RepID=UPI001304C732|nr:hypothetical protein [Cryobacterium sp. Y11]
MAPRDDEHGIGWLASQLGQPDDDAVVGDDSSVFEASVASSTVEPIVAAAVPVDRVEPAAPAPWWTTPLSTPVSPAASAAASTDPASTDPASTDPASTDPTTAAAGTPPAAPNAAPVNRERDAATTVLPAATTVLPVAPNVAAPRRHRSRRSAPGARQAALIWTAVGLLTIIVLVGLFYLGQRLVASPVPVAAPAASASATPTPTPTLTPTATPTPTPEVTAMQPAGPHDWNTLFGGECLEPYVSPWEEEFTVVDCAAGHTAQLVFRGNFGGDAATVFPGEAALAAQINLLCTTPGILDLSAAGAYPNLQMQGSYPITEAQWTNEPRNFYCFVSRASAEPLSASIMGAGPGV